MKIEKYPLTDSYYIIVFEGRKHVKYSLSKSSSSWVIENGNSISTEFSNRKLDLTGYQMFGKVLLQEDSKFDKIIEESEYKTELPSKEAVLDFISKQGFEITEDTWMICPKSTKKLTGKRIPMIFDLGNPNFEYGDSEHRELDVFMTPITKDSKSVRFSVMIPKHIYNQCMTDPNEELRPKYRHIESETLSYLHSYISSLVSQALGLRQREKDAERAKKVICINFNSAESTERDSWNFGYVGQKINTSFNFYVCYYTGKEFYSYYKVDSGVGSMTSGIKGVLNNTISGHKSWINQTPKVMIDWTQEREDFLRALEGKFREMSTNLNKFLKDLDVNKLDLLVTNNELLKLNN